MIERKKNKKFYRTGEVAKLLGISFRTVKRWIYSGEIKAKKSASGWYYVSSKELNRLRAVVKGKKTGQYGDALVREIRSLLKEKIVAYLRELQVCLEDNYEHWRTRDKLTELVSKGILKTVEWNERRWYFPTNLKWEDVEEVADNKFQLMDTYINHPRRFEREGIRYSDYSEYLVERAMIEAGYRVVAKDTYYFHGIEYRPGQGAGRPADIDFIAHIPERDLFVGVQVKNKLNYPKARQIRDLVNMCRVLGIKPVFVGRMVPEIRFGLIKGVGRIIACKRYFLQPPFPRDKFSEIAGMGIPLGVYTRPPDFLIRRFREIAKLL